MVARAATSTRVNLSNFFTTQVLVIPYSKNVSGYRRHPRSVAAYSAVELANLPAPPTSPALYLYPLHPSPTFPLSKLY